MEKYFNLLKSKDSNSVAIITEDEKEYTYGNLIDRQKEFIKAVGKRSLLFIVCTNTMASLVGYTACLRSGNVPLLLDESTSDETLESLQKIYKPRYLWIPESWDAGEVFSSVFQMDGYRLIETGEEHPYGLYEELALLLMTSGSTGSRKLVRQSYKNIRSNTEAIIECLDIGEGDRAILTLPMSYTYGLSVINTHLYMGATILLTSRKIVERLFWDFVRERGATSLSGVPLIYETLKKMNFASMEVPSLKTLTQAGGKLSDEVHRYFAEYANKTNRRFYVMYGQTEATARISYLPYEESVNKLGSIGIPIPDGKWWIVDEEGKKIQGYHQVGEIVYEGRNVMLGYSNRGEDLSKCDENNGILYTGDVGYLDEDGFGYITGRKNRYVKIYGNRVNLNEVEGLLSDFTRECTSCIQYGDHLYIFMEEEKYKEGWKEFISGKMNLPKSTFRLMMLENLPKTNSGKNDYKELEEMVKN